MNFQQLSWSVVDCCGCRNSYNLFAFQADLGMLSIWHRFKSKKISWLCFSITKNFQQSRLVESWKIIFGHVYCWSNTKFCCGSCSCGGTKMLAIPTLLLIYGPVAVFLVNPKSLLTTSCIKRKSRFLTITSFQNKNKQSCNCVLLQCAFTSISFIWIIISSIFAISFSKLK